MAAEEREQFEQTPENLAAEEEAFNAAFEVTDPPGPAAEVEEKPKPEAGDQAETPGTPAEQPVTEAKPLTMDDVNAALAQSKQDWQRIQDKVFGTVGELKQRIDAMKTTSSNMSPKAKERLTNEFPELAKMLFDEEEAAPAAPAAPAPAAQVVTNLAAEQTWDKDPLKVMERKMLTNNHRDWETVVATPEFAAWKDTVLAPADSTKLDEEWDSLFISDKLTEFKTWKATQTKQAAEATKKNERLNSAITPRGNPRSNTSSAGEDDEEAAMEASYKKRW